MKPPKRGIPKGAVNEARAGGGNRRHLKFLNKKRLDSVDRVDLTVEDPVHNVPMDKAKKSDEGRLQKIKIKNNVIALAKYNPTSRPLPMRIKDKNSVEKAGKEKNIISLHNKAKFCTQSKPKNFIKQNYSSSRDKCDSELHGVRHNSPIDCPGEETPLAEERKIKTPAEAKCYSPKKLQRTSEAATPKKSTENIVKCNKMIVDRRFTEDKKAGHGNAPELSGADKEGEADFSWQAGGRADGEGGAAVRRARQGISRTERESPNYDNEGADVGARERQKEFSFSTATKEYLSSQKDVPVATNIKPNKPVHNAGEVPKSSDSAVKAVGKGKSPETTKTAIKKLINTMKRNISELGENQTEDKKELGTEAHPSKEIPSPHAKDEQEPNATAEEIQPKKELAANDEETAVKKPAIISGNTGDVIEEKSHASEIETAVKPHNNDDAVLWNLEEDDVPLGTDEMPLSYKDSAAAGAAGKGPAAEECNISDEESVSNGEENRVSLKDFLSQNIKEDDLEINKDAGINLQGSLEGLGDPIAEQPGFGIEYFFGENAVPPEIVELVDSLNGYADDLVERKRTSAANPRKNRTRLDKIEEEASDQDTPLVQDAGKKTETPVATARLSLNPVLQENKESKDPLEHRATLGSKSCSLDIKALCRGLAYAIRQHILFARGKQTFEELKASGDTRFSYRLGRVLKIDLDEAKQALSVEKSKDILSDSLSILAGTRISRELLTSYLTTEENEDELEYTKSQIGDIFGDEKEDFMKSYRNSLANLRASQTNRFSLSKGASGARFSIRGFSDVGKFLESQTKSRSVVSARRMTSLRDPANSIRLEETKDQLPKKNDNVRSPSDVVPDDIFEISKDQEELDDPSAAERVKAFAVFQLNYDFDASQFYDLSQVPEDYLVVPSEKDIYEFCKKIIVYSKMEMEIPIIALIYVEKLIISTGLLMNELNWRRFIFTALVIASKVWDDESFQDVDFTKVFTDVSLKEINALEMVYMELLDYRLNIKGSEYAKYYFILRTVTERISAKLLLKPITVNKMVELQSNAERVQKNIKQTYEIIRKTQ